MKIETTLDTNNISSSTHSKISEKSSSSKSNKERIHFKASQLSFVKRSESIQNEEDIDWMHILFLIITIIFLVLYTFIVCFGEILLIDSENESSWCNSNLVPSSELIKKEYENPDHITDPCHYIRIPKLLFLTLEECDFARRILLSVILGATIGYERKTSERPAGVRTMSLVCLGACYFTVSSQKAFLSSTMGWDAARVSAAIPSGVGFLGAGLIWKGSSQRGTSEERHEVHGLTTAASVWLSAAVGIGAGGNLVVVSIYAVVLVVFCLRLGPRMYFTEDNDSYNEDDNDANNEHDASLTSSQLKKILQKKFLDESCNENEQKISSDFIDNKQVGPNVSQSDEYASTFDEITSNATMSVSRSGSKRRLAVPNFLS